jgi:ferritin
MISEKLMNELNVQVKHELFSANLYLSMASYCADEDLMGFANFFRVQAEEEKFHGMKFFDYIIEMNGRAKVSALDEPKSDFSSILDAFQYAYEHEQFVTKRIYGLTDLAMEEREHATLSFLKWFIDEQVEEESMFNGLVKKLQRIGDNANALYMLDAELAQRVFTPPAAAE